MNWLKDVYVTKKIAAGIGSADVRNSIRDGRAAFAQAGGDYLTRGEFTGANADAFHANCGILPTPIGNNAIKNKVYINSTCNADIFVMPAIIQGEEKTKAATAFAAIAKAVNSMDEHVAMMKAEGYIFDADSINIYENYITKNYVADLSYLTQIIPDVDPIDNMVIDIARGTREPMAAIEHYEGQVNSVLSNIFRQ